MKNETAVSHTPGPFKRIIALTVCSAVPCYNSADKLTGYRVDVYDVGGTEEFFTVFRDTAEKAETDARLIAAAPELLAALRYMVSEARASGIIDQEPCMVKARAAIAKATA